MSDFSEQLKEIIHKKRMSVSRLASEMGIDRTLLQKYMSGRRIPQNYQDVMKIGKAVALTSRQMGELLEAYYIALYGEKNYKSFLDIKKILEGLPDLHINDRLAESMGAVYRNRGILAKEESFFWGRLSVEQALNSFLHDCFVEKQNPLFRMMIQPQQNRLMQVILCVCSENRCRAEHIICFDSDRSNNENLGRLLQELGFETGQMSYQSYYYYEDSGVHESDANFAPNMVLAENSVFLCSGNAEECLILRQKDAVRYFTEQYEKIMGKSRPLGVVHEDAVSFQESLRAMYARMMVEIDMQYSPCLLACFDEQMLLRHIQLDEPLKVQLVRYLTNAVENTLSGKRESNYFSEKGLREFMQTGYFQGCPKELQSPGNEEERLIVIQRMIDLAKSGKILYYMAVEDRLSIRKRFSVLAEKEHSVMFYCFRKARGGVIIEVEEAGIRDAVCLFAEFAKNSGWFYSKEETIRKLEEIRDEYRSEWGL